MGREKIQRIPELSKEEIEQYHEQIKMLSCADLPETEIHDQYRDFFPDKALGRAICESYTRDTLIRLLIQRAGELGGAPSQNQVFSLYRTYIKRQFGTWPNALQAAGLRYGLKPRAPQSTDWAQLLEKMPAMGLSLLEVVEREISVGRYPTQRDVADSRALRDHFGDWETVLGAAHDLDKWLEEHPTPIMEVDSRALAELKHLAVEYGRTPLRCELPEAVRLTLKAGCGSWKTALQMAELASLSAEEEDRALWEYQQRKKAGNCPLKFLREPTQEQKELLQELELLCRRTGRTPLRDEIPADLYQGLLHTFGSWRNALFQLRREPLTRQETSQMKRKKKNRGVL